MTDTPSTHERLAVAELLSELGQSLSSVLGLDELLTRIVNAAVTLTNTREGLILLLNPESGQTVLRAQRTAEDGEAQSVQRPADDRLAEHVLSTGRAVRLTEGDAVPFGEAGQVADTALIYLPLTVKGKVIGVIGVSRKRKERTFNHQDEVILTGLASYAAVAIENARLYQQALDRTLELSLLVESATAFSWSLDLGSVVNAIGRHLMRGLNAHGCLISDWQSETATLRNLAEHRLAAWPDGHGPILPLWIFPAYRYVLQTGDMFTVYGNHPLLERLGAGRMVVLPLQVRGSVVGLAEICNLDQTDEFDPQQISRGFRAALDAASLLGPKTEPPPISRLYEAARVLVNVTGADWCTIFRWEDEEDALVGVVDYGSRVWLKGSGPIREIDKLPTVQVVVNEQRIAILHSNDPGLTESEADLFRAIGKGTLLLLPLIARAKTVGLAQLYDTDPAQTFTERETGLAHALASQAAIALENAHLVHDLQRSLAEQKAMQSHLVRAARFSALGEMAAVIAHQINNPLTTVLGDAEILIQDLPASAPGHDSAEAIYRAGSRAQKTVERVLKMARFEESVRPLDVNNTIQETIDLIAPQVSRYRIRLEADLSSDLPPVSAIPGHLEDIWMNLITNARDAIAERAAVEGVIRIASGLCARDSCIEVTVRDNGRGIAPGDLDRIFDPFFTTKPAGKGTGLGLYICRQILLEHDGDIQIASTPGEGTTIIVRLPCEPAPTKEGLKAWPTS